MQQQDKPTNQRMVYAVDGKRYDVHSLPVEAQQALKLMLEVDKKLQDVNRERAICIAATTQLNTVIHDNLTEQALLQEEEDAQEETVEELSTIGGRAD